MAVQVSATTPANGTAAIYTLIDRLCAAGWLVKRWSDATTLSSDDVNLTTNPYGSSSSGAGNLGNTSAWFRIAAPDASREWLFQRGSADQTWTVTRGRGAFTGGSPNATTVGTDSTSQALFAAAQLFDSSMSQRWLVSCESASPYGFTAFTVQTGGGNVRTLLFDEPMATGSTETGDADTVACGGYYNGTGIAAGAITVHTSGTVAAYKRFRHGLSGAANIRVDFIMYTQGSGLSNVAPATANAAQIAIGPITQVEVPLRIPVGKVNASPGNGVGWSGFAARWRWSSAWSRSNGQTLYDAANSLYWVYCAGAWIPWDSSTPSI